MSADAPAAAPAAPEATPAAPEAAPAAPSLSPAPPSDWLGQLGEDLKHPSLERIKGEDFVTAPRALVKNYVEAQNYIASGDKIPRPREDWTEEQLAEHYERLGRPTRNEEQTAFEAYGIERPETLPEGFPIDEKVEGALVDMLYQKGLSKQAAQGLYSDYMTLAAQDWQERQGQVTAATEAAEQSLREEWGDGYEGHMQAANAFFHKLGGDQGFVDEVRQLELSDGTILGNNAMFVKLMAAGREWIGEDANLAGAGLAGGFRMDPAAAAVEYAKIEKTFYSMDPLDTEYGPTRDRMAQLAKMAGSALKTSG